MIMNYNALAVHTTSKQVSWELKDRAQGATLRKNASLH